MRRFAVVFAGLVLSGCFGMCGYMPESAVWAEPGLYEWMEANRVERAEHSAGGVGLPFDAEVGGVRPKVLRSLAWQREGEGETPYFRLEGDGNVSASGRQQDEDVLRRGFRSFAANVSAADTAARRAAEDAFIASGTAEGHYVEPRNGTEVEVPFFQYRAALPGPYRLAELFNETGAVLPDGVPDPYREVGTLPAHAQGYTWEFGLAHWSVALRGGGTITVDLLDSVKVAGVFAENDDDADIGRKVRRAFDDAGLPEPHLDGMTHGGPIC